jgi:hypothetical protein
LFDALSLYVCLLSPFSSLKVTRKLLIPLWSIGLPAQRPILWIAFKVLPVGGIQQKIRAAHDAGVKEVLLPAEKLKEAEVPEIPA